MRRAAQGKSERPLAVRLDTSSRRIAIRRNLEQAARRVSPAPVRPVPASATRPTRTPRQGPPSGVSSESVVRVVRPFSHHFDSFRASASLSLPLSPSLSLSAHSSLADSSYLGLSSFVEDSRSLRDECSQVLVTVLVTAFGDSFSDTFCRTFHRPTSLAGVYPGLRSSLSGRLASFQRGLEGLGGRRVKVPK